MRGAATRWVVEVQERGNDERLRWVAQCTSPEAAEAALRLVNAPVRVERRPRFLGGGWATITAEPVYRAEVIEVAWEHIKDVPLPVDSYSREPKRGEMDPWTVEGEGRNWRIGR